jgi:sulfur-carrier protein
MWVEIKLFAVARQRVGSDCARVELPSGATIADLRTALVKSYPTLADTARHFRFALNSDYAQDDSVIPADAEIACIPPVSGG